MRYRRYWHQTHPDGSRSYVSVGPAGLLAVGFLAWCAQLTVLVIRLMLLIAWLAWPLWAFFWPSHGAVWGLAAGSAAELVWLLLLAGVRRQNHQEPWWRTLLTPLEVLWRIGQGGPLVRQNSSDSSGTYRQY